MLDMGYVHSSIEYMAIFSHISKHYTIDYQSSENVRCLASYDSEGRPQIWFDGRKEVPYWGVPGLEIERIRE